MRKGSQFQTAPAKWWEKLYDAVERGWLAATSHHVAVISLSYPDGKLAAPKVRMLGNHVTLDMCDALLTVEHAFAGAIASAEEREELRRMRE